MKKLSENEIWVWFIDIYSHFSVDKDSIFGELGGNGLGGAFRGGVGNFLGGFGSLGTGGALTTLPVVGDFRQFNQALSGKCIIVGRRARPQMPSAPPWLHPFKMSVCASAKRDTSPWQETAIPTRIVFPRIRPCSRRESI